MNPNRISLPCAFLLALLAATPAAHAVPTCPAGNVLSTPTTDFTLNGNGTVTHLKTGLMWKQCAEGLSTTTTACDTGSATAMNWSAALSAAATLYAGYSDWRLPNKKELHSIVEYGCYFPSINDTAFPATPSNLFWSSTTYASLPAAAWLVVFDLGISAGNNKGNSNYVRLVRGGQPFDSFDAQKTNQSISFGAAPTVTVGGNGIVSASATSGLAVSYASSTAGVCTVAGSTVTGVAAGTCTIAANQAGNGSYNAATQVMQNFTVITPPTVTYTGSAATGTGTAAVSVSGGGAGCGFTTAQFILPNVGTPAGVSFPHGLLDFTLGGCTSGSTVTLAVTYPSTVLAGTQYWKYGPTPGGGANSTPHWYTVPATISGNILTFNITDGQLGDDDLTVNGTIVDQGGAGIQAQGNGVTTAIPTLSEWGVILLAGVLGLFGMGVMRRQSGVGQ